MTPVAYVRPRTAGRVVGVVAWIVGFGLLQNSTFAAGVYVVGTVVIIVATAWVRSRNRHGTPDYRPPEPEAPRGVTVDPEVLAALLERLVAAGATPEDEDRRLPPERVEGRVERR